MIKLNKNIWKSFIPALACLCFACAKDVKLFYENDASISALYYEHKQEKLIFADKIGKIKVVKSGSLKAEYSIPDFTSQNLKAPASYPGRIFSLDYIPEKQLIVLANIEQILVINEVNRKKDCRIKFETGGISRVRVLPEHNLLIVLVGERLRTFNLNCAPAQGVIPDSGNVNRFDVSPGRLVILSKSGTVFVWKFETFPERIRFRKRVFKRDEIRNVFLSNGDGYVVLFRDAGASVWDLEQDGMRTVAPRKGVSNMYRDEKRELIVFRNVTGRVILGGKVAKVLELAPEFKGRINALTMSEDGEQLFLGVGSKVIFYRL